MIVIDTDILKQLVSAASSANQSISEAVNELNRIVSHDDWACKERTRINDYTVSNANRIKAIQNNANSFLSALSTVLGEFESTEDSISSLISGVDSTIADVLSTNQPLVTDGNIGNVTLPSGLIGNWLNSVPAKIWRNEEPVYIDMLTGDAHYADGHVEPGGFDPLRNIGQSETSQLGKIEIGSILDRISICEFDNLKLNEG